MDIKNDFAESLDFIKKLPDIEQKFNLLIKYGEKFIEKKDVIDDAMKVILSLVDEIINIRNNHFFKSFFIFGIFSDDNVLYEK